MEYVVAQEQQGHDIHIVPASECRFVIHTNREMDLHVRGHGQLIRNINELIGGSARVFDSYHLAIQHAQKLSDKRD